MLIFLVVPLKVMPSSLPPLHVPSSPRLKGAGGATEHKRADGTSYYLDKAGNRVDKDGYRVDNDGKAIYDFQVNGAHINVTEDLH